MLWCTELDTAENFGLTSIQKPLIAISKCPLLNIHPVGENVRGTITKNNKWGGFIKDDNFMITCADRANWMAGLVRHPHILGVHTSMPS